MYYYCVVFTDVQANRKCFLPHAAQFITTRFRYVYGIIHCDFTH